MTIEQWNARGEELYGADRRKWKFRCVACGNVQSAELADERNPELVGVEKGNWIYFSCEGRRTPGVGCDWSLGGLFQLHCLAVIDEDGKSHPTFEFADDPVAGWKPHAKGRPHD
jgi:hypothetical protein